MQITPTLESQAGIGGPNAGPAPRHMPLGARVAARVFAWRLDHQLAAGAWTAEHPALAARADLASVAALLQSSSPCNPRGIALIRLLLRDGASPRNGSGPERQLEEAVRQARPAMELGVSS
jgi:hypothetical protein